jgi:hypothetical protein
MALSRASKKRHRVALAAARATGHRWALGIVVWLIEQGACPLGVRATLGWICGSTSLRHAVDSLIDEAKAQSIITDGSGWRRAGPLVVPGQRAAFHLRYLTRECYPGCPHDGITWDEVEHRLYGRFARKIARITKRARLP